MTKFCIAAEFASFKERLQECLVLWSTLGVTARLPAAVFSEELCATGWFVSDVEALGSASVDNRDASARSLSWLKGDSPFLVEVCDTLEHDGWLSSLTVWGEISEGLTGTEVQQQGFAEEPENSKTLSTLSLDPFIRYLFTVGKLHFAQIDETGKSGLGELGLLHGGKLGPTREERTSFLLSAWGTLLLGSIEVCSVLLDSESQVLEKRPSKECSEDPESSGINDSIPPFVKVEEGLVE